MFKDPDCFFPHAKCECVATGLAIAGLASAGAGLASANASRGAARDQIAAGERAADAQSSAVRDVIRRGLFDAPSQVDFRQISQQRVQNLASGALDQTANAVPRLNQIASQINQDATDDVEASLNQLTGGRFGEQRDAAGDAILAQLQGRLSPGTREVLSREALGRGITELGGENVDRAFIGFLGLTAEQQAARGIQGFNAQTALFGGLVPRTTGAQLLPFGGLTTQQALAIEQFNVQGQFAADQFNATGEFQARINQANALLNNASANANTLLQSSLAATQTQLQGQQAAISGIGNAVGSIAGGFAGLGLQQGAINLGAQTAAASIPVDNRQGAFVPSFNLFSGSPQFIDAATGQVVSSVPAGGQVATNPQLAQQALGVLGGSANLGVNGLGIGSIFNQPRAF